MTQSQPATHLRKILGLSFGLAVIFGGTVGVGILRMPGVIAAQLGNPALILVVWTVGALYALLGANSVAELGSMMPQAGGFYIYSRRAFGPAAGFAMGWADWLNNCAVVAYAAVTAAEYLNRLVPVSSQTITALVLLALFCTLHWFGIQLGSRVQQITSSLTALTFLALAFGCFMHPATQQEPAQFGAAVLHGWKMLVPLVAALRAIVVTYDGWYEAIYFTEEDTNAARNLPRAMMGGVAIVLVLYLIMNLAFLRTLPMADLAASNLPAADAAQRVFSGWGVHALGFFGSGFVTVLALLTLLSLMNAVLLGAPRILVGLSRDGLFTRHAADVAKSGTPRVATILSAALVALFIMSGKFEELIAIAAILVAAMYCVNYVALIVLRLREPAAARPYRAWGYPATTLLVLAGSVAFLGAAILDDATSAWRAAVLLGLAVPVYFFMRAKTSAAAN